MGRRARERCLLLLAIGLALSAMAVVTCHSKGCRQRRLKRHYINADSDEERQRMLEELDELEEWEDSKDEIKSLRKRRAGWDRADQVVEEERARRARERRRRTEPP